MTHGVKEKASASAIGKDASSSLGCIGILMGGDSSEKDISVKSGKAVFAALKERGYNVKEVLVHSTDKNELIKNLREAAIDVAFIALHGRFGEDGGVQELLENLKIPYNGSGVKASSLAINKVVTQNIFLQNSIPVPAFKIFHKNDSTESRVLKIKDLAFPVVVKPAREGSSIGVTLVQEAAGMNNALRTAFGFDEDVLAEQYVRGRELTVGVLAEEPLPIVEIRSANPFFDFSAKYEKGRTEYIVPALISEPLTKEIQSIALKAHKVLGCRDFSRVDVILSERNEPYVLEINTIPGFTSTSLLPKAAKVAGLEFADLCVKLIELAYAKFKK